MSRLENLRQRWRDHPFLNSNNWDEKFSLQRIYEIRIAYGFLAGISLPLIFENMSIAATPFHKIGVGLLYGVLLAVIILIDRSDVRDFKKRFPDQEAFK